ncbi:MAG: AsmA-like C-terminal region-containing protein, partial [Gammaproteobacteria bacterium]
ADLLDTHAEIKDLTSSDLQVQGNIRGPIADMLRYVEDSPLGAEYGEPLGPVEANGVGHLSLGLRIPLRNKTAKVGVSGKIKFTEDQLRFIGPDLSFSQVEGELNFTENGFDTDNLEARLNEQLVQVRVGTRYDEGERETWVELTGSLGLINRMKEKRWPILSTQISGSTPWQATIRVPKKMRDQDRKPLVVELQSNLQGVQVDLPAPLGKEKQALRSFELATTLEGDVWGPIRLQYSDDFSAALKLRQGEQAEPGAGLERGELKFGGEPAQLPEQSGLYITGRVSQLSVTEWIDLLVSDNQGSALPIRLQGLEVEYLEGWELAVERVKISASNTGANWNIQVRGPTCEGILELRENEQGGNSLRMVMDRLEVKPGPKSDQVVSDPAAVPALDITVQQAVYSGIDLGKLSIKTSPRGTGMHVDSMGIETDWIQLQSAGDWLQKDGEQRSDFEITLMGGDLGKLLDTFGYVGSVSGGETEGQLSASWKGSPAAFAPEILTGRLTLDIKKGQLLDVEPGAGRIFGLLSVQALPRRLSGDFGDLFKKGFSFDRISGSFALQEGDAYTDDLVIDGPAATIEVSGRTGLGAQDYDQVLTIIPSMRSSLPIAGAIAVGPVAGAAIFLADKILAKPAGTRYRLTGSWDEPQLEPIKIEDKPEHVFDEDYDG